MTEPLIDRSLLADLICTHALPIGFGWDERAADAVLAYLRSVLTPEALTTLTTAEERERSLPGQAIRHVTGTDLHRRIFGEDR